MDSDDMLVVSDLGVRLRDKIILEDVSFNVKKGSTLAIVGPNGGGKTTLFKVFLKLVRYTGSVRWSNGVRMGYVPQTLIATDLPISVEEFLKLKTRADFEACLRSVGLGRETLSQRVGSLSGGELQRVLIAWATVDRPNVLLFDEPTSGVDIGAEEPIYKNVNLLKTELGITTLLISHNMHVVMHYSDYVLALNKRVLFFGESKSLTHTKLLSIVYGEEFDLPEHEHQEE